jgi:hypothetical protein
MNTDIAVGSAAAPDRFDAIVALLARYPHLNDAELAELKRWFAKEASAFDIASLATREDLREPYTRFRAEHVDRFGARDMIVMLIGVLVVAGVIAYHW